MMITKNDILENLKQIIDPELEVNIVDLGLIYDIKIDEQNKKAAVFMTLTSKGCPLSNVIKFEVEESLKKLEGIENSEVNIVWEPEWNYSMIKPEILEKLHKY
ncbi:MAG: metal-sulfur cluster assembly factor [Candidatus Acididesulfobacter diazotrophicus]|uniref:Metal-sulfur cluster assembly factor n=1 Tax=Candidatus Acididesulfobacter diazotrophicus TaxID=2597226 RepID=A0A519BPE7_9DELT|nr:MAG: metal-sulfur cluster assembly factor [Candidatus Acididesulfobacter diazotrophicus]